MNRILVYELFEMAHIMYSAGNRVTLQSDKCTNALRQHAVGRVVYLILLYNIAQKKNSMDG